MSPLTTSPPVIQGARRLQTLYRTLAARMSSLDIIFLLFVGGLDAYLDL